MHRLELDRADPVPLYHQLAEALRYQIATGVLAPGALLPPLRRAAELWGVNLHTVRRAYAELGAQGMVATRGPAGTRVLPAADGHAQNAGDATLQRFLERVLREARQKHGLDPADLSSLLERRSGRPSASSNPTTVHVVECSRTQCEDLAGQLEARWRVSALPWPLSREDLPPAGLILATYFHYNDLRVLLAGRLSDVRFAVIRPDPQIRRWLRRIARSGGDRIRVLLCEREASMAQSIAADLSRILPADEFELTTAITSRPEQWLQQHKPRLPVLFAPRMWGGLSEAARNQPRVHEVRYVFDPRDLESIGRDLGWQSR